MRRENELRWICPDCENEITTFVKVSEPPVCSRHLKPVRMAEAESIKRGERS